MSETTFDRPVQWPHRAVFAAVIVAVWLMLLRLVWRDTLAHPAQVSGSLYAYSDWLINYAGGFVRRGLAGELLRRASGGPIAPATLNLVVFTAYAAFSLVFLAKVAVIGVVRGRFVPALVLLFVPGGLYTMASENEFYLRKDFLFLLFLWSAAALAGRLGRRHTFFLAYVGLGSIVLSCVHEGFLFFCAVPLTLLLYDRAAPRTSLALARAYLLMCGGVFALFALFKGGPQTALAIWQSIGPANRALLSPGGEPQFAIRTIGWSLWDALELPAHMIEQGMAWYWLAPLLFCAAILIYLAVTTGEGAPGEHRRQAGRAVVVLGAILVGTLPLFPLGWDWGRWIVFATMAFLLVFDRIDALPERLERLAERVGHGLPGLPAGISALSCGLACLIFELTFRMPACCIEAPGFDWSALHVLARAAHRAVGG